MQSLLDYDQKNLVTELSRGRELARQLQIHLNVPSSSHENHELLVHKILNSYDKVMTMLKSYCPLTMGESQQNTGTIFGPSDSSGSFSGSPMSEDSDHHFKYCEIKTESKKRSRKSMPRWTQQVQVCPGTGLERPLDDGYSWRKYGQKDILGAKYPRGYYRCTHRNIQGCLATKQVQRSDDDPTVFDITCRGRHTCTHNSHSTQTIQKLPCPEKKLEPNTTLSHQPQQNQHRNQSQEILLSFKTSLKVITDDLQTQNRISSNNNFDCFSTSGIKRENIFISPKMTENNFPGNYLSTQNISPATSLSNDNFVSPDQVAGFGEARDINGFHSELIDNVSMATSANNSPNMGFDFPFGPVDPFEPNFFFDSPSFFCDF